MTTDNQAPRKTATQDQLLASLTTVAMIGGIVGGLALAIQQDGPTVWAGLAIASASCILLGALTIALEEQRNPERRRQRLRGWALTATPGMAMIAWLIHALN